jgi:uncharacterized protein YhaN
MKLRNWHIDGFGVFCGAALPEPGLGDGFNLLIGPNEAGKSTLLDFLRYTLFGYPSGHTRLPRREPLRGGSHGGTVIYEADGLTFQVYRDGANRRALQLRDQNDAMLTEADLARHFGHVSGNVFRNILGFSLAELQELKSLTEGDVRDLIFAASIGQSAARIRKLEDSLSKQSDAIFREGARPGGLNAPRVVKLRQELDQLELQLDQAIQITRVVGDKLKELETKRAARKDIDRQLEEVEREIQQVTRLVSGWPLWVERCQAEKEKCELGDVSLFPVGGDVTWATLKTEFDQAKRQVQTRHNEAQTVKDKLGQLPAEFPLLRLTANVEELATKRSDYDVAKQRAVDAKNKSAEAQQSWKEKSEELGPDWFEQIVRNFDASLLTEDDARKLVKRVLDSELAISGKRITAANLAREARSLSTDCASKAQQFEKVIQSGPLLQSEEIAQQRTHLGEFREARHKRESLQNDFARAQDHLAQVSLFTSQREPAQQGAKTWLPGTLVIASVGFAAAAGGLIYAEKRLAGAMSLGFALVLIGIAFLLRSQAVRGERLNVTPPELNDAQNRYATAENALQELDNRWITQARDADLSWPVSESELTTWEGRIGLGERRLDEANTLSQALVELRGKRLTKINAFRAAKREVDEAEGANSASLKEWSDFLHVRRLPQTIQIETALAVFSRVKEARQNLKDVDDYNDAAEQREEECQAYIRALQACIQQTNAAVDVNPAKVLVQFERLRGQISDENVQSRERQALVFELHTARKNLRDAVRIARTARGKLRAFLNQLGVGDEPGFTALSERARAHAELTLTINEKDTVLATIFGQSGVPLELQQAWDSGTHPEWETEQFLRENEQRALTSARDKSLQDETGLEIEINSQLKSDEVARLQLEAEEVREEIRKGIEDWLNLATAQELLRRTREKFERENQSPVLDEASRVFRLISNGRYERIFIPLESAEGELTILPKVGPALSLECLSRGTLEQLYLCIRLGYIRHYQQQQGVSLPLLMDDVAVNFDAERMAKTFEILTEYCRQGQQIVFFSCHEELIRLLHPEASLFRIRDFDFESSPVGDKVQDEEVSLLAAFRN